MSRFTSLAALAAALLFTPADAAAPNPKVAPITRIKKAKTKPGIFKAAKLKRPLVLKTEKDATAYFTADGLAVLKKQVDFKDQIVLVFAWRGSGSDKLTYSVAESYPEQIFFKYKRGLTRDLRPHVYVFALRSNVRWRVPR